MESQLKIKTYYSMKYKQTLIGAFTIALLASCGGGGSSSTTATNNTAISDPAQTNTQYLRPLAAEGDTYTFKVSHRFRYANTWDTYYRSEMYSAPNAQGLQNRAIYVSGPYNTHFTEVLDKDGVVANRFRLSYIQLPDTKFYNTCNYDPGMSSARSPYFVGQQWSVDSTMTCATPGYQADIYKEKNTGKITAIEEITLNTGKHKALKEVFTTAETMFTPFGEHSAVLSERTCWRDVSTGIYVKCNIRTTETFYDFPASAALLSSGSSYDDVNVELIAYETKSKSTAPAVERFAGPWDFSDTSGTGLSCMIVPPINLTYIDSRKDQISADGNFSMNCTLANNGTRPKPVFQGKIDANGNVTLTTAQNNVEVISITGKAESLIKLSGTWSSTSGRKGSWVMTRPEN